MKNINKKFYKKIQNCKAKQTFCKIYLSICKINFTFEK